MAALEALLQDAIRSALTRSPAWLWSLSVENGMAALILIVANHGSGALCANVMRSSAEEVAQVSIDVDLVPEIRSAWFRNLRCVESAGFDLDCMCRERTASIWAAEALLQQALADGVAGLARVSGKLERHLALVLECDNVEEP